MDAIIIKVAGIGLKAAHLGKTLTEMQPTLRKLVMCSVSTILLVAPVHSFSSSRTTYMGRTYVAKVASTRRSP